MVNEESGHMAYPCSVAYGFRCAFAKVSKLSSGL